MSTFTLMDMFPAFGGPEELDARQIRLLELAAEIGVPFPAECNSKAYGNWWRSLHEICHWAVKPLWYVIYAQYLRADLTAAWGSLRIPAGTVAGVERDIFIPRIGRYEAGNDVIPDIGLLESQDGTPSELETRVMALQIIDQEGWPHPSEDNVEGVATGDQFFHKPSSARVWMRAQKNDPEILASMERWGLDVPNGRFRPYAAPDAGMFELPYPQPISGSELRENSAAIAEMCGDQTRSRAEELEEWDLFLARRWPDEYLRERFMQAS